MASITITLILILDRIVLVSFPPIIPMLPLGGVEATFGCSLRTAGPPMASMCSLCIRLDLLTMLGLSGRMLSAPPSLSPLV